MGDDRNDEALGATSSRRSFLGQIGAVGGAAAGLGLLAEMAEAQPKPLKGGRLPKLGNEVGAMSGVMTRIRDAGLAESLDKSWDEHLGQLNPTQRVATVAALEVGVRGRRQQDVNRKLSALMGLVATGLGVVATDGAFDPAKPPSLEQLQAAKDKLGLAANGVGCGNGCGSGCGPSSASGFFCGNNCGKPDLGEAASGFFCGNNCSNPLLGDTVIDERGVLLGDIAFAKLNICELDSALQSATAAYAQVFK